MKIVIYLLSFIALQSSQPISPEAIYKIASKSVVFVFGVDNHGNIFSQGSGVVISKDSIATNWHVVEGSFKIKVKFGDNIIEPKAVYGSPDEDVAILCVSDIGLPQVKIENIKNLKVGKQVYAIGNPKGLESTMSNGIISSIRSNEFTDLIQTTAPISPGSSGGGLFSENGALIGITSSTLVGGQNLNFAIPVDKFLKISKNKSNYIVDEFGIRKIDDEELAILNDLEKKNPDWINNDDIDFVISIIKKKISIQPNDRDLWFAYGDKLYIKNQPANALKVFQHGYSLPKEVGIPYNFSDADYMIVFARISAELKKYKEAEIAFRTWASLDEKAAAQALYELGSMFFTNSMKAEVKSIHKELEKMHNTAIKVKKNWWDTEKNEISCSDMGYFAKFCTLTGLPYSLSTIMFKPNK